jgi:AGZA family xanthine/uracil permease-like MFS transporter
VNHDAPRGLAAWLDGYFRLHEHGTTVRTELLAGLTTFLTMAYIIFVQPSVLSRTMNGEPTGMDFGAITAATCLAAAVATAIMALYARYPVAQAPGMGQNFFFVATVIPAAGAMLAGTPEVTSQPWQVALGVVFCSGVLFLGLSFLGVRQALLDTISPSIRHAIGGGIGLFIAFIGLRSAGLVLIPGKDAIQLNYAFASPDLIVFFFGLVATAAFMSLRVRGAIFWGIASATALAVILKLALDGATAPVVAESALAKQFAIARVPVSVPPSMLPTLFQMDVPNALRLPMVPFILIFLFMVVFDTLGTLVGVAEHAGLMRDNQLPRAKQAFASDAIGSVVGAAFGTSTVTSFIESTAGVEQGGRTGLTALTTAALFVLALFFYPLIKMVGSYPPITAPALVIVGAMMMRGVARIDWGNYAEAIPAFLIVIGIPLSYSIADGLALGFISYPIVKVLAGQRRDVKWPMYLVAVVLVAYFVAIRSQA